MMDPNEVSAEVRKLVDAACNGTLDPDEQRRLDELSAEDSRVARYYAQMFDMHAELYLLASVHRARDDALESIDLAERPPAPPVRWLKSVGTFFTQPTPLSMTVAALVVGLIVTAMAFVFPPAYRAITGTNEPSPPVAPRMIALLTGSHNAQWAPGQTGTQRGARLLNGHRMELYEGIVEVSMRNGVRVIVEGPAELVLDDQDTVTLSHGKVVSHVPEQAAGFAVMTGLAEIVDLGTSFGAAIPKDGNSVDVEVFKGVVEFRPSVSGSDNIRLSAGQRITFTRDSGTENDTEKQVRFARNLPATQATLIGVYPFEGNGRAAAGTSGDATVTARVDFVEGYEGRAARFAGSVDSYIDLPINVNPDQVPVLTWGAWVRPTAADGRRSILSTDEGGFDRMLTIDERGGHAPSGASQLCAHGGPQAGVLRSTCPTLPTAHEWVFVAAIYDGPAGTVTLLVEDSNGKLHRDVFRSARPDQGLGHVRVGAHAAGFGEPFVGEIDNVFLFRGRLDTGQLQSIRAGGMDAIMQLSQQFPADDGKGGLE